MTTDFLSALWGWGQEMTPRTGHPTEESVTKNFPDPQQREGPWEKQHPGAEHCQLQDINFCQAMTLTTQLCCC